VAECATYLAQHWQDLLPRVQCHIHEKIRAALSAGGIPDPIDVAVWHEVLRLPVAKGGAPGHGASFIALQRWSHSQPCWCWRATLAAAHRPSLGMPQPRQWSA